MNKKQFEVRISKISSYLIFEEIQEFLLKLLEKADEEYKTRTLLHEEDFASMFGEIERELTVQQREKFNGLKKLFFDLYRTI